MLVSLYVLSSSLIRHTGIGRYFAVRLFHINVLHQCHLLHYSQLLTVIFRFSSSGGVELVAKDGKIRVVNTLESRLDLLSRQVCIDLKFSTIFIL